MARENLQSPGLGVSIYTRFIVSNIYRLWVLRFSFTNAWNCAVATHLLPFFRDNFTQRHLDCGVADGYFLASTLRQLPRATHEDHELTLLDLNPVSLHAAQHAVLAVAPECRTQLVVADIRSEVPESLRGTKFDSISMFNLFHCVPGGRDKFDALKTYAELLNKGGVLVGCTILGQHDRMNWLAGSLLTIYNWTGIFHNRSDTEEELESFLRREFVNVETWRIGMVLVFKITHA